MTTYSDDEASKIKDILEGGKELGKEGADQVLEIGVEHASTRVCSGCDCDLPCNLLLFLRLSTLLLAVATLVPRRSGGRLVAAAIRFYRRRMTRFTPRCPSTPSCSAFALDAVAAVGPRYGLVAAAARIRNCGR